MIGAPEKELYDREEREYLFNERVGIIMNDGTSESAAIAIAQHQIQEGE